VYIGTFTRLRLIAIEGDLVAAHRKVHLFDIDIPGKMTFKVSWLEHSYDILSKHSLLFRKARLYVGELL
jgi:hypothetical protein